MKSLLALDRAAGHKKICINILFTKDGSQNDRSMYSPNKDGHRHEMLHRSQ